MAWYGDPELQNIVSAIEVSVRLHLTLLDHIITREIHVMDACFPSFARGETVLYSLRPVSGELIEPRGLRQSRQEIHVTPRAKRPPQV